MPVRAYGLPYAGYASAVRRDTVPLNHVGPGSKNFRMSPSDGRWVRRKGSVLHSSSLGMFEDQRGLKARKIYPFDSPTFSGAETGFETYGVLLTDETDKEGAFCWYDPILSASWWMGKSLVSWAANHYPNAGVGAYQRFKMVPLWAEHATRFTRCMTTTQRALVTPGSRGSIKVGDWRYFPNSQGTPCRTDERYNTSAATTQDEHIQPWGMIPPLWARVNTTTSTPQVAVGPWMWGDWFWVSVIFKYADGSYSKPFTPRVTTDAARANDFSNWGGLVRLEWSGGTAPQNPIGDAACTAFVKYITWAIPCGGPDVVERLLIRSTKINNANIPTGTAAWTEKANAVLPPMGETDWRIVARIRNNTQVLYTDYDGEDSVLIADDGSVIRWDQLWPRRARYVWANDSRIMVGGGMKPSPGAIILAPRDMNGADTDAAALYGSNAFYFNLQGTTLRLRHLSGGAITDTTITLSASKTVQQVVDEINQTVDSGSNGGGWAAQLVPGGDGGAPSTALELHGSTNFGDDDDHGTWNAVDATGNCRSIANCLPVVAYFSKTYLDTFAADEQALMFTGGGPLHAPGAAQAFYIQNERKPPNKRVGPLMGGAPLLNASVVCYANAIYLLRNIRGGGSGEDADYRLVVLNESRGCISPWSITSGDGFVGYLTRDGYVVTDGETEVVISRAIFDRESGRGDWIYEVEECVKAVRADGGLGAGMFADRLGETLSFSFRIDANTRRRIVYDYSTEAPASGLATILTPEAQPFGWSTPYTQDVEAVTEAISSSGTKRYGARSVTGSSGDGLVDQIDSTAAATDRGTQFSAAGYGRLDLADTLLLKSLGEAFIAHYHQPNQGGGYTGFKVRIARGHDRTVAGAYAEFVLSSTPSGQEFARVVIPIPIDLRAGTDVWEVSFTDDGSGSLSPEFFGLQLPFEALASLR